MTVLELREKLKLELSTLRDCDKTDDEIVEALLVIFLSYMIEELLSILKGGEK